ncbi:MAG: hypothetical protein HY777_12035 [Betaproteobacteria bacterium]|nr:hypothetical protein [Betaproteobacteria bacterium]
MGWTKVSQMGFTVQGKFAKPDWSLLLEPGQDDALIGSKDHTLITAVCESKDWRKTLDTGKANRKNNPHHHFQDYLSTFRVRFGFLTNGHLWRVYDTDKITAKKTFIEFDLQRLWGLEDAGEKARGLALFAFFSGRDTCLPPAEAGQAIAASADFMPAVEENLKAVIYGTAGEDSLFKSVRNEPHPTGWMKAKAHRASRWRIRRHPATLEIPLPAPI